MSSGYSDLAHAATPILSLVFPSASQYTNMDYFFLRKNDIEDFELDRDSYPWIIWYIWKTRNDKLYIRVDRNLLETVRYAESECHAWFEANHKEETPENIQHPQQMISSERCMIDGSLKHDTLFSSYGWTFKKF